MNSSQSEKLQVPAWVSAFAVISIVLGLFLSAYQGTEWMKYPNLINHMPAGEMPLADCPPAELQEEGLTLAECRYMVAHVEGIVLSMPLWFPGAMMWLAATGTLLALSSVFVGGWLMSNSSNAIRTGMMIFAGLTLIDVLQFVVVVNAGPILRDLYLWHIMLWFLIHLMMTIALFSGQGNEDLLIKQQ